MYKICFYVPETHLEKVKTSLFELGAGKYKNYDSCSWEVLGTGQFRGLDNSSPFIGQKGKIERVNEYRVEMICKDEIIKKVLAGLIKNHPYEEPAYDVTKIFSINDFK